MTDEGTARKKGRAVPEKKDNSADFFRCVNFYIHFVYDYDINLNIMTKLMLEHAFDHIKEDQLKVVTFAFETNEGCFALETDASNVRLSYFLHQKPESKDPVPNPSIQLR